MENQINVIKYQDKDEKITQFLMESNEQYEDRLQIIKKMENENMLWKESLSLSKVYYNVKYRKCKYNPYLYNKIKKYL